MGRRPSLHDAGFGVAFIVVAQAEVWTSTPPPVRVEAAISAVVAGLALMWRRVLPTASAVVVLAAGALVDVLTSSEGLWGIVALIVAMYSAGRHASTPRAVALLAVGLVLDAMTVFGEGSSSISEFLLNYAFIAVLMVAGPWATGFTLRRRERQGIELAAAAVGDERLRLARELHDVVGHSLGVIAVQAGAERATLPDDAAESTRETLGNIEQTTREALAEMRRLVSVMRGADGVSAPTAPQPTLAQVDTILTAARHAGWSADLHVEGDPAVLSPGVELTAYRIIQEAVTNAVRHSHGTQLKVTIRYLADELQLGVLDDGGPGAPARGVGFGLAGMRERAALYGGNVEIRRSEAGGFVVEAILPHTSGSG
jgi:signal transduction histidine kinase